MTTKQLKQIRLDAGTIIVSLITAAQSERRKTKNKRSPK
jgi:hypothetical protein